MTSSSSRFFQLSSSSSSSPAKKKAKLEMTTTTPNWLELPRDLTANILQRLGAVEILTNARNVCPYWWTICKDPSMWRNIQMGTFHLYRGTPDLDRLVKMCQYAVDLSSGHLEKIDIYRFGTDNLLRYIADRASHLRCIQLESCVRISDEGWCEVAKKFPLLEEVYISHSFQCKKSLEVIGQSCPLLKSLTLYGMPYGMVNDDAFVIANTMPGLHHLGIHGNQFTNVGLLTILDGCPLLESLDIKGCDNLDITESLWHRLNSQIKDLLIRKDCPNTYNNVQLEFAYEDSSDDSYSYLEDEEVEEEDDDEEVEEDDDEEEEKEDEEVEEDDEEEQEEEDEEVKDDEEVEEEDEDEEVMDEEVEEEDEDEEVVVEEEDYDEEEVEEQVEEEEEDEDEDEEEEVEDDDEEEVEEDDDEEDAEVEEEDEEEDSDT